MSTSAETLTRQERNQSAEAFKLCCIRHARGELRQKLKNLQEVLERIETTLSVLAEEVKGVCKEVSYLEGQSAHE